MGELSRAFFKAVTAGSFNPDSEVNSSREPVKCRQTDGGTKRAYYVERSPESRKEVH